MKKVKDFNEYLEDLILEKAASNDLPFVLSKRLFSLLKNINHPISSELLNFATEDKPTKFTLVDYHNTEADMFTYSPSNKIFDYIATQTLSGDYETNLNKFKKYDYSELFTRNRVEIKVGKFIKRLFGDRFKESGNPGKDIESFVTLIKSERDRETSVFQIVEGEDIVKYYFEGTYTKTRGAGSTLHSSCMMYEYCIPYIGFYAVNKHKVKMIIMKDDKDDIKGRALIWDVDKFDGEEVDRKFMDRIYTSRSIDVEKFIKYAKSNNWLYKSVQNSHDDAAFIDPSQEDKLLFSTIEVHGIKTHKAYPYLDTLRYFFINEGILTNNSDSDYDVILNSTSGGYTDNEYNEHSFDKMANRIISNDDLRYCEREDIFLLPEFTVYSRSDDTYLSKPYAKENYKYSKLEDDWIPNDEAVYIKDIDDWIHVKTAEEDYIMCGYDEMWYSYENAYPSEEWGCVPADKMVLVITNEDIDLGEEISAMDLGGEYVDARYEGDGTYFEVQDKKNKKTFYLDYDLIDDNIVDKIKKGDY